MRCPPVFLRFGDLLQGMHSRQSLPQILLSPGSDLPTPSGDRVYTPSFYNSYSNGPVMRDFHVVTGTLNWEANDLEPKLIPIQIVNDIQTEFSEDMIEIGRAHV